MRSLVKKFSGSPFVLFVSTIEKRKNHELLYRVWVRLIESGCEVPQLLFVGMRGWGVDELLADISRDRRVKNRIHVLNNVSDAELTFLYDRCLYTLYPSFYEGWGLPVVESLAFGKFCLCSNAGSLTEAGEDFCEYIDPWDVNAWTSKIRYFVENPEEIEKRNRNAALSFKAHSWEETSRKIMHIARELLHEQRQSKPGVHVGGER
jgi:glycosyltransferase involved in cell wall biosynthesis